MRQENEYPKSKVTKLKRMFLWVACLTLFSCEEGREAPEPLSSSYLPLNSGQFWTYEVEEREYFGENDFEDRTYFLRDRISRQYFNQVNELVSVVTRQRSTNLQTWENELAYTLQFSNNRIVRTINNEPLIPLVYPLSILQQWDANGMNTMNPELFTVESIGPYIVGSRTFGTTAFIRQSEEDDLITKRDIRFEVYAEGVGMVASSHEVFTYCSRSDCLGEQIIQRGRFTKMKLIANGIQ